LTLFHGKIANIVGSNSLQLAGHEHASVRVSPIDCKYILDETPVKGYMRKIKVRRERLGEREKWMVEIHIQKQVIHT